MERKPRLSEMGKNCQSVGDNRGYEQSQNEYFFKEFLATLTEYIVFLSNWSVRFKKCK